MIVQKGEKQVLDSQIWSYLDLRHAEQSTANFQYVKYCQKGILLICVLGSVPDDLTRN